MFLTLINRCSVLIANSLKDLTEAQLVAKASTTLELMLEKGIEAPKDLTSILARCLLQGGILYELDSKILAEWFNIPSNHSNFFKYYASNVTIREQSFHILMENVPITFVPDSPAAITDIENKAGFKARTISKARYIKPIARCQLNQRMAHVAITLSSKASANQAIKTGLVIVGKKVYRCKLLPEPAHCLKCHSFEGAHIAANCTQKHDMCGTCGDQH